MNSTDLIGSVGVAILLGAFFANLVGWIDTRSRTYSALNFVGATTAAIASWGIGFIPFVVLESTWAAVALASLVRSIGASSDTTHSSG